MSALAGIFNFDGAPVNRSALDQLSRSLAHHGPDGGARKQTGNIGITFRAFHTDDEAKLERQPLVSTPGHILAWDGRLDNRPSLLRQLAQRHVTDVEIVMAAYIEWGTHFLSHLVGDFALSLWDPSTRTLLLARDPFGTRPIYYHATAEHITWSSELAALVDAAPFAIDEEYVASYLSKAPDVSRTAYKHIRSVPPGFALVIHDNRIERREFWRPDVKRAIRYRLDAEYEEHFRELFRDAVGCRLRSAAPVWAELSGGLDSSSVVCMADQIVEPVETVSYLYDHASGSDERRFIAEVEKKRGRTGHHFHEDDFVGRFHDLDLTNIIRPNPTFRFTRRHTWVQSRMQKTGSRVLLSGVGGDDLLWSGAAISPQLADLLSRLKLRSLHREVKTWSQATRHSYGETFWRGAVVPVLTRSLHFESTSPHLLDQKFAKRLRMNNDDPWGFKLPSGRVQAAMLSAAISAIASCYYRDRVRTEYRFPFLHQPLVEFLLAIPIDQKLRPAENRSVQRRALKHLLPETVLTRRGKRWPTEALCRTLSQSWSEVEWLFQKPRVCEYGFVDDRAFSEAAKRVRHGLQNVAGELSLILSIELWLRALESRRSPAQHSVAEDVVDERSELFQVAV